jgi:PAS domain S-box-containing protein
MPLALLFIDADGTVSRVTGAEIELFGKPASQLVGSSADAWVGLAPGAVVAVRGALRGLRSTLEVVSKGRLLEVLFEPTPPRGCLIAVLERSATEAPHTARLWRFVFSQFPGAVWATDRELRFTHIIGRLAREPELRARVGKTLSEVLTDQNSEPVMAAHRSALEGNSSSFRVHLRGRTYEMHLEPLRDQAGRVAGTVGTGVDVTEREQVMEELARSRGKLAEAQELAHIGSWEWTLASDEVRWSEELYRIYGVPLANEPMTLERFLEYAHPDDRDASRRALLEALRSRSPFSYEKRVIRPDGSLRMLEARGSVVLDEHGVPVRLVGSCWDVTDRWQATRRGDTSTSLFQATLDAVEDGVLVIDKDGRVAAFNRRFCELWRIPEELIRQKDDQTLLAFVADQLEDPTGFLSRVNEIYVRDDAVSTDVLWFKDGRVFERRSHPQFLGGKPEGRVWSFNDVSERERLLRRTQFLADASRLLASLDAERALEAVVHLAVPLLGDACAVDLLLPGGPRRLLSVQRDPARPFLIEPPTGLLARQPTITSHGETGSTMMVPLETRDGAAGALIFIAAAGRRYGEDDLGLAEELARRVSVALENAQLYRKAREALKVRDEFLSVAAHEIRGPVTSIHLAAQMLNVEETAPSQKARATSIILREDRRLARFVDELLDVGRISAGRFHFDFESIDLAQVARDVVGRLGQELAASGSSLSLTAPAEVRGTWDRMRLEQLITNLLSNAVKFGKGKPIDVKISAHTNEAKIEVIDRGIGIPENMREQIFRPFERGVDSRHYGGLGLGLYIVRMIAEGHGGEVQVQSQEGVGSTFTVTLPRTRA